MTVGADLDPDAALRERRSGSALLLVHGCLVVMIATTNGIMMSVVMGSLGAADPSAYGLAMGVGLLVEWAFVVVSLACAAFELWIAVQLEQGQTRSVRIAALAMIVGSLALLPAGFGCSMCGCSLFLLPLGWALAGAVVVARIPDARFAEEGP